MAISANVSFFGDCSPNLYISYIYLLYHNLVDCIGVWGDVVGILVDGVDVVLVGVVVVVVEVIVHVRNQTQNNVFGENVLIASAAPGFLFVLSIVIVDFITFFLWGKKTLIKSKILYFLLWCVHFLGKYLKTRSMNVMKLNELNP